ncbi:HAD family hydrolase [Clostridium coskatii]|uniref:Phosphorylated carbohydrates phosphatase n=1 Tax=Clostridium coskatii TaxID=1705578 RepID=A0A166T184_9CLOT|nr:HAD family phosphatase [Clostridium coskatii]OAA93050.1 Phosphorylated carbohydrates phosphatase [Clostridium coskatii]OBR90793.1 phosphorylated carbohydrates phosphatase [Clostridium coskatii]
MLKNIKGAIFDMDGTLIDSMWMWENIDEKYLARKKLTVPPSLKSDIEHMSFYETAEYFKNKFNILDSIEEIQKEWYDMAIYEYSHNISLKPRAKEFLLLLKKKGIKIALATSNYREITNVCLKKNKIYDLFDSIITGDEVSKSKAFPDIYICAAQKLNLNSKDCVVFEDVLCAVKGAKSAGMTVIGVHDLYSEYQWNEIINYSDMHISNYTELIEAI